MKKIFLVLIFVSLGLNAQSVKVTYSEKRIITPEKLKSMPEDVRGATLAEMKIPKLFTLEASQGISFYEKDKSTKDFNYQKTGLSKDTDGSVGRSTIIVNKKNTPFFYYKDINQDLMLFKLTNSEIEFDGKDKLIQWDWEILTETKVINGYKCKKAISNAFKANFIAWFTEEIPMSAGPEKFGGLPGLILYVDTGAVEFFAEKIEVLKENSFIIKPETPQKTVTFLEMFDIATKKHYDIMNSKNREGVRIEAY